MLFESAPDRSKISHVQIFPAYYKVRLVRLVGLGRRYAHRARYRCAVVLNDPESPGSSDRSCGGAGLSVLPICLQADVLIGAAFSPVPQRGTTLTTLKKWRVC